MNTRWVVFLAALALAGAASASSGDFIAQIGSPGSGAGQLDAPWGTAVDGSGNVYVTDTANARVQVFTRAGAFVRTWGNLGAANGQLDGPTGIAVCASDVFVADTNNDRVQHFDTSGNLVAVYGGMSAPHGLACDGMFLYVADTGNHRIAIVMIQDYGQDWPGIPNGGYGSGPDQYDSPSGVAIGPDGRIYVADTGNDRVLAVGVGHFGASGAADGQLAGPIGIAVDRGGNVYVVDRGNSRFQAFTATGGFLGAFGSAGTAPGQLATPSGIAYDQGASRLVLADSGNDRLQAFSTMASDLAVTALTAPASAGTSEQISVTAAVRNEGPGAAAGPYLRVLLSTDPAPSSNDVYLCGANLPTLAPGAEQVKTMTCTVPTTVAQGTYYLLATTNGTSGVYDPVPANDTRGAAIQVYAPDLVVPSVTAPSSAGTLQSITVSATVLNQGLAKASASLLSFSLVSSATGTVAAQLGNVSVGALAAGGQQSVTATYSIPWNISQGSYVVRATADVNRAVRESNESNNATDSHSVPVFAPDLVAVAASFPALARQGETVPVSVTIVNQGGGGARGFNGYVVLTRDGGVCTSPYCDETDDDWFLGAVNLPGLAAGAQVTVSVPTAIPADFVPLSWNVFTVLDWEYGSWWGNVGETDETNNTSAWGATSVAPASTTLIVGVDIKPGSSPNSINLGSNGVVPVAILSSPTFDATTVDPLSVTLASSPIVLRGNGTPSASAEDVNGDRILDLVVQVATEALQLTTTSTSAALQGHTYSGQAIAGTDDVNVVP